MAIDTRDKRASAIGVALPWRSLLPAPDGVLDQGDRQQVALHYRGIAAANPSPQAAEIPARPMMVVPGRMMGWP